MAEIVGVHGILNDYLGEETTASTWGMALRDGLRRARYADPENVGVRVVFYGDLYRKMQAKSGLPHLTLEDLNPTECDLLLGLADQFSVPEDTKRAPRMLQWALRTLLRQDFFAAFAGAHGERALLFGLRQVRLYLHDPAVREQTHERFAQAVTADTRVVVGHSLGSIVAYECLCSGRYPQVRAFVSLGSPLGMPRIVFDCLQPAPVKGRGLFPPVTHWTNIADEGDLVAMVKHLRPLFGDGTQVNDAVTYNGWESHDVLRYLTAEATGVGIAHGLG